MQIDVIIPLIAYLILVFTLSAIACRYSKRNRQDFLLDYFLGNRSMGGFLLAMTLATTYVSASSFIGGPGAAYKYGLGWVLLAMIQLPAIWLSLGILGKKFAILARRYQAITLNDFLLARYQNKAIVWLASISLLIAFMGAMTVQFVGGARLLESAVGIPYGTGLLIFGLTVALYTAFGGFRASILNDAMQGIVMLSGTFLLLFAVIKAAGGLPAAIDQLNRIDPALTSPQGVDGILSAPFMASFWVLVCFGVIGLPHTAMRCLAYRDSKALHRGMVIGTLVVFILMLGMHLAGSLGRAILPDLEIPDKVIPTLIMTVLPPFAAGIFLAAPIAAIMSTVNAQLLQSSATLIKDLYLSLYPQQKTNQKRIASLSHLVTLMLGLLLLFTAWRPPDMILWLNLLAFGGLQAVFLWPLVLGLYWEKANASGAIGSMLAGASCYITLLISGWQPANFHPIIPALLVGLVVFYCANRFGQGCCPLRPKNKN